MKTLCLFGLMLLTALHPLEALCREPVLADLWPTVAGHTPADALRAIPNNTAPPDRLTPRRLLPPLPEEEEGIIRRVDLPNEEKVAALTFDLCELVVSTSGYDAELVDFLRGRNIPATFFVGGKWMRTHAERAMQLMLDPSFELGNHAWTHGNLGIMAEPARRDQVLWTQAQYELLRETLLRRIQTAGFDAPALPESLTLFRLPYGRASDQALNWLAGAGLQVIQWDVVADTSGDNTLPEAEKAVVSAVRPGSILLFHANLVPKGSASLLRRTVDELLAQGYRFVTVSELLTMGTPQRTRDGYFLKSGDNRTLDLRFGVDGTGRKR